MKKKHLIQENTRLQQDIDVLITTRQELTETINTLEKEKKALLKENDLFEKLKEQAIAKAEENVQYAKDTEQKYRAEKAKNRNLTKLLDEEIELYIGEDDEEEKSGDTSTDTSNIQIAELKEKLEAQSVELNDTKA